MITVEKDIKTRLKENFGVEVSGVDIGAIEIDTTSEDYRRLKLRQDALMEADVENYEETLRIQREECQYATHKQTQTQNIGAFQIEKQVEVGVAGAEALGKMGSNGTGRVNLGNGAGFNPASMMASIAVGGIVGKNIADTMNNAMSGVNNQQPTPPPIPVVAYNVAKDGKPTGPFDLEKLKQMASAGEINAESLVWKQGMPSWVKAGDIDDLKGIFPPPIL